VLNGARLKKKIVSTLILRGAGRLKFRYNIVTLRDFIREFGKNFSSWIWLVSQ